jgi:hypothetical protein
METTSAPKTYYEENKERVKERYLQNVEKNRAYQIEYNLINHEKYTAYQKSYYESKKDEILRAKKEKTTCECGKIVSAGHMTCHKKTNIHLKRMAALET